MKLGKNAEDNWALFHKASQRDWWFHLDRLPSGHVFVPDEGKTLAKEKVLAAAELVRSTSKAKKSNRVKVIYCRKSNLKLGTSVGEVIIKSHKKCNVITI